LVKCYGNAFKFMAGRGPQGGEIHQYEVTWDQDIPYPKKRKALVLSVIKQKHVPFDGNCIFVPTLIPEKDLTKSCADRDGKPHTFKFKKVGSFPIESPRTLVLFNLLLKKAMTALGHVEINNCCLLSVRLRKSC